MSYNNMVKRTKASRAARKRAKLEGPTQFAQIAVNDDSVVDLENGLSIDREIPETDKESLTKSDEQAKHLIPSVRSWNSLEKPLSEECLNVLHNVLGFQGMTPVQAATIPLFLSHKDVVAEAVTGSGKTLSFVIPLIEILKKRDTPLRVRDVGGLIILPTRELAIQVSEVSKLFLNVISESTTQFVAIGGTNSAHDVKQYSKSGGNILVGTPGRLLHLIKTVSSINLKSVEVLILDEADRLLDLGFKEAITDIIRRLPKQRRTGLFSATQTQEIEDIIRAGLRNPVRISVKVKAKANKIMATASDSNVKTKRQQQVTPTSLNNFYKVCSRKEKLSYLINFIKSHKEAKSIVFLATCACVDYFTLILSRLKDLKGIPVLGLHGKMVAKKRVGTFENFKNAKNGVLFCTDVAARGIDLPDLEWVIQYDPPQDPSVFVHRCGRTARQGRQGNAVVMLTEEEDAYIEFLKSRKVPLVDLESIVKPSKSTTDFTQEIRIVASKDRDVLEKANKALVSFVRSYREHLCSMIFRIKELSMVQLCEEYGILFAPKMPELKGVTLELPFIIEQYKVPYANKNRERQRQKNLVHGANKNKKKSDDDDSHNGDTQDTDEEKKNSKASDKRKPKAAFESWSKQKEKKARKIKRREIKDKKREYKERQIEEEERKRLKQQENEDEWDDLQKEARKMKDIKKGKISDQFDEFDDDV